MPTPIETISGLHTKVADAAKGYEEAVEIGNHASVKELCAELRQRHLTHAHELAGLLLARGEHPNGDGSFMSYVHKAALNMRFVLTADETSLLPGLRDGEKRLLEAYDDTLRECEIGADAYTTQETGTLAQQREAVVANIGKIDALQKSTTGAQPAAG